MGRVLEDMVRPGVVRAVHEHATEDLWVIDDGQRGEVLGQVQREALQHNISECQCRQGNNTHMRTHRPFLGLLTVVIPAA